MIQNVTSFWRTENCNAENSPAYEDRQQNFSEKNTGINISNVMQGDEWILKPVNKGTDIRRNLISGRTYGVMSLWADRFVILLFKWKW
jgi:hypothetical protein